MASPVSEIASLIPSRPGVRPWWERVDKRAEAHLTEILAAWRAGKFGSRRRTAARAIAAWLVRHGVHIGEQGVDTWLRRNAR
jgi:hypothetical protein